MEVNFPELEKGEKLQIKRGELKGGDCTQIYYNEVKGDNSKTSKGKIQITHEGTRIG